MTLGITVRLAAVGQFLPEIPEAVMPKSFRLRYRGVRGRIPLNVRLPGVIKTRHAVVHITAGQVRDAQASSIIVGGQSLMQDFIYNLGDADVWISNVSPHGENDHFPGEPGGVEFILHVDYPDPLDVAVTICVDDAPPVSISDADT
ncbi:hypothetical protein ACFU6K_08480 [Kitasatospora sp. NPDC057512]|uniref:hypothetical protein n=1 Tax=Kitasatospora sp. NPDC057512 TaxID=3346154 RepID=UPI00369F0B06